MKNGNLIATVEDVLGVQTVKMFTCLLRASESRNTLEDVFTAAIRSKYKSESERLAGKVLTRFERLGVPAATQEKVKKACGIGGSRIETEAFADVE